MCRCGFLWTLKAETTYGSHLLPNEVVFEECGEAPPRLLEYAAQQSQVLRCPNCRAVMVEDEDGIHLFVAATEPPRLYVRPLGPRRPRRVRAAESPHPFRDGRSASDSGTGPDDRGVRRHRLFRQGPRRDLGRRERQILTPTAS